MIHGYVENSLIIEELFKNINSNQISMFQVFLRLITAGISGFVISAIYRLYHKLDIFISDMMYSLIFLSLIICTAMMIIGNNLASAFGLVGAVSIIRFRTSVKSAREMSFVFFAVVTGMACGLGYIHLALIGLIFTGIIMVGVYYFHGKDELKKHYQYKIKISFDGTASLRKVIEETLTLHCIAVHFKTLKIEKQRISCTYVISLEYIENIDDIISALEEKNQLEKIKIQFSKKEQLLL